MTPLQVDKLWSIVPAAYVWHFALHDRLAPGQGGAPLSPRLVVMGALATAWAVRLTFNFARKGGYRMSAEDYRWPYIRERLHWFPFMLFNLSFISLYQSLLLLSLAAPAYVAWQNTGTPLNAVDAAAAALCAFFISYEAIADQQQWNFQVGEAAGSSSSSGWQRRRQHQGMPAAAPASCHPTPARQHPAPPPYADSQARQAGGGQAADRGAGPRLPHRRPLPLQPPPQLLG